MHVMIISRVFNTKILPNLDGNSADNIPPTALTSNEYHFNSNEGFSISMRKAPLSTVNDFNF